MTCQSPLAVVLALDHVAVPVASLEASAAFYRLLGLRDGYGRDDLRQMNGDDGVTIELLLGGRPGTGHLALSLGDLPAGLSRLAALGLRPDGPIRTGATGVRFVFLSDPDGNRIELIERVPTGCRN